MTTNGNGRRDRLGRLARLNPMMVFLATLGLFLVVLFFAPDVIGGLLILVIAGGLTLLLTRTWPVLPPTARILRLLVIGLLVAVALTRMMST